MKLINKYQGKFITVLLVVTTKAATTTRIIVEFIPFSFTWFVKLLTAEQLCDVVSLSNWHWFPSPAVTVGIHIAS
jgi:hypothetical protein